MSDVIEHDIEDIGESAKRLFHHFEQSMGFDYLTGTSVTWLSIIRERDAKDLYMPDPNPCDPNQLCITVMLAKPAPAGIDLPQEWTGKKGTYKVFYHVTGRAVFA